MLKNNFETIIQGFFILLGCKLRAHLSKIDHKRWRATVFI
jgi:hypothetical protein